MSTRRIHIRFLGSKARPVHIADNLTAVSVRTLDNVRSLTSQNPYRPPRPVTAIALLYMFCSLNLRAVTSGLTAIRPLAQARGIQTAIPFRNLQALDDHEYQRIL
jgi:hypothetical protein